MPIATQNQLAQSLGISRSTVAAALNPKSRIKLRDDTVRRVQEAAARLHYRPHRYAQMMRGRKSGLIGVFHFGGLSQVAAERAWHASKAIQDAGYRILSTDISWSPEGVHAGCEAMLDAQAEGVLVAGLNTREGLAELKALQRANMPIVTLSGNELPGAPHVRGDAQSAMAALTEHLIGLGWRRLLFLTHASPEIRPGSYLWAPRERLKGFTMALTARSGSTVDRFSRSSRDLEGVVLMSDSPYDFSEPYRMSQEIVARVLRESPRPDAILCGNDDWAIGALAAARQAGLRVPQDLAITGYDNIAISAFLDVPLTTVAQPSQAMATRAVELLLQLIQGRRPKRRLTKFPCDLVIRSSCGAREQALPKA